MINNKPPQKHQMWSPQRNKERNRCLLNRRRAREVGRESSWEGRRGGIKAFLRFLASSGPPGHSLLLLCKVGTLNPLPTPQLGGTSPSTHGMRATVAGPWDYVARSVSPACTCMKLQPPRESANNGEDNHQSKAMASTWQCPFKGTRYK